MANEPLDDGVAAVLHVAIGPGSLIGQDNIVDPVLPLAPLVEPGAGEAAVDVQGEGREGGGRGGGGGSRGGGHAGAGSNDISKRGA